MIKKWLFLSLLLIFSASAFSQKAHAGENERYSGQR